MRRLGIRQRLRRSVERVGYRCVYGLADLTHAIGLATPRSTVAGRYWSYEPRNAHGDDPGLAALAALPDDAVVLDIGAHVGEYAVPLAIGNDRRVFAFEPNRESANRLVRTAKRNGVAHRIELHRIGLGKADEERPFYRSTYSKLSAFDPTAADRWGAEIEAVETISVRRLDSLVGETVDPPDGIKIDVEGAERDVLEGAERTIETRRPLVVIDVHEEAARPMIEAWFIKQGYACSTVGDTLICRPTVEHA